MIYDLSYPSRAPRIDGPAGENDCEVILCPLEDGHRHTGDRMGDLSLILPSPKVTDIMKTWMSEWLITRRAVDLFAGAGLKGYSIRPTKIAGFKHGPQTALVPSLYELVITGWGGIARPESGMRILSRCPGCNLITFSNYADPKELFDVSQWDGSDFFRIYPLGYVFVTERVLQIARQHKLKYAKFVMLDKLPKAYPDTISARPLSQILPEPLAARIGKPLGIY